MFFLLTILNKILICVGNFEVQVYHTIRLGIDCLIKTNVGEHCFTRSDVFCYIYLIITNAN